MKLDRIGALAALLLSCSYGPVSAQSFVNFESKQVSPIRLSPDGSRLFAVNTPDNRLSVFDLSNPRQPLLIAEVPVGLDPVSVNVVNNDEAWVVNEVSDSISIVSVSRHVVTDTLYVKDEPGDVVFANGRAFVTASRNNRITVIDQATHAIVTHIPVFGEHPRAITVNSNGTRVYAAFALSGNRTTLVPLGTPGLPSQPTDGMKPGLPTPPDVSLIVDATDPMWTNGANAPIQYAMPDNDIVEIDTSTLAVTRYFPRVGTINLAIAVQPGSGDLFVANTDARNTTPFEPVIRGGFVTNQISRVNITNGAVTRFDLNTGFAYTNFPNPANQSNALAQPTAIAFGPSGANYFITAFGSDRVALVSAANGVVTARIDVNPNSPGSAASPRTKRGPRGLALKPGVALYVANRISNTLTIIDPGPRSVVREIPIGSHDPTPATVRNGRGFLYDAKLSGGGLVSCASCHIDAERDLLAWDLGNPQGNVDLVTARISGLGIPATFNMHPMKGPMTTQTLRGLRGLDPLHWRGDRTNFANFAGAFDGLLGGTVLSATDMLAYSNFIVTIVFQPNPNQNLDRTLTNSFGDGNPIEGRKAYLHTNYVTGSQLGSLRCNVCHAVPNGTDKSVTPSLALQEPQDFKVPQLRDVYQKMTFTNAPGAQTISGFGLVHDGSDPGLFAFLSRPVFGPLSTDEVQKRNISGFVQSFDTGTAPAVGYSRTLTAMNVNTPGLSNDWILLEQQANLVNNIHLGTNGSSLTNIDLVVKGTIDGRLRGFLYQAGPNQYRPDTTNLTAMTRSQLRAKVLAGDTLTIMGVPPGSGMRIGIDRNENGVPDADEPPPALRITSNGGKAVVAWATNPPGFLLERATLLPATSWNADTNVHAIVGSEFNVTNSLTLSNLFFRLREL